MTRLFRIEIASAARRQADELNRWWRTNRSAARSTVNGELARAFRLIRNHPSIGPLALDADLPEVRRIHLSGVAHYLYYRVHETEGIIEVLAVWPDRRGEGPPL